MSFYIGNACVHVEEVHAWYMYMNVHIQSCKFKVLYNLLLFVCAFQYVVLVLLEITVT